MKLEHRNNSLNKNGVIHELVEVTWVMRNELIRSFSHPEIKCMDAACKTNRHSRPLVHANSKDSENKRTCASTTLLYDERRVSFNFIFKAIIEITFIQRISPVSLAP